VTKKFGVNFIAQRESAVKQKLCNIYSVPAPLFTPLPLFTLIGKVLQFCLILHQNYFMTCYSPILHLYKIWGCDDSLKQGILCNGVKSGNLCFVTFVRNILHSTIYRLVKICQHHNYAYLLYQSPLYMERIKNQWSRHVTIVWMSKFAQCGCICDMWPVKLSHSHCIHMALGHFALPLTSQRWLKLPCALLACIKCCKEFKFFQQELR
jgi:hypothetical protein